jgi:hypothetical protein
MASCLQEQNNVLQQHHYSFANSTLLHSSAITSAKGLISNFKNAPKHESEMEEQALISAVSLPVNKVTFDSNEREVRKSEAQPSEILDATSGAEESNNAVIPVVAVAGSTPQNFPLAPTSAKGKDEARGNSHDTGSLPADLSILAEILDLPLIILENSLDGKPITLFNIILTWLMQKTSLSLCKCLDALDHCVCYAR